MAITKPPTKSMPKTDEAAADAFITGAPDAEASTPRRVRKGRRVQVTVTMQEEILDRVDQMAKKLGQSRAAVINLAITQMIKRGLHIDAEDE